MIDFLTPLGAIVALAGLVPLLALRARHRRDREARAGLGLPEPGRGSWLRPALAVGAIVACLAVAAAQPVVFVDRVVESRADAEAYVVVDVSRSMLAAAAPQGPTRFDRAIRQALALRRDFPDVPFGVASLTDRPLPNAFPTPDVAVYDAVLTRSLGIERPPPEEPGQARATDLGSLDGLAKANFFSATSTRRLVVVLTDAESVPYDAALLRDELAAEGISLVVVRLWAADERIWRPDGTLDEYRPDPSSAAQLDALAATGVRVVEDGDAGAVGAAGRAALGTGPSVRQTAGKRAVPLAAYVALAAVLPLALLLARRGGARRS